MNAAARKRFTPEEDSRLVKAFDDGAPIDALARAHGRSRGSIESRLHRLGQLSAGAHDDAASLRKALHDISEIAQSALRAA